MAGGATGTSSRRRELDAAASIDATRWRERLDEPPAGWTTFVAESATAASSGFAAVGPSRDERGLGELYAIYVEPTPGRPARAAR